MKAIIVDDSKAIRRFIRSIVSTFGFEVIEAGDGVQALDMLQREPSVELALVDWNMPRMNGFELVQAIRSEPAYDGMLVVMVTSEAELDHMELALEAGANEYMMKPFTREGLRDKLSVLGMGV
jgi:two-component system chemotaxis response regulator CheY